LNRLAVAIMFLTRIPVPGRWEMGTRDVGRSMIFFPLVGAALGGMQWLFLHGAMRFAGLIREHTHRQLALPAPLLSILLVVLGAWATGALHLDGLADMADGFGGGRTREDVLRIMRDHAIGSYGAVALILSLALKLAAISLLIEHGAAWPSLIIAPAVARASGVALGFFLPYARASENGLGLAAGQAGWLEVLVSTLTAILIAFGLGGWLGGAGLLIALLVSTCSAVICFRRIQGVTGDTLGANIEICETLILALGSVVAS
jgi:adenosylcobinamide-GDP ribazoletransferase